jgi:exoribonuclease-2
LRHTTIYFPDHHVPLIPCNLTDKVLNLGASPFAITFSAKFHANGDIMDYKVQPSIIKNIQHISYTDTDRILKGVDKNAVSSKDLKDIKDLMDKHLEYRSSQGAFSTEFVGEIMLDPYPFKDPAKTWISQPINYPRIQLKLEDDSTAKIFVAECMIVAGRVGARFMTEYKIPTLYRGQEAPNLSTEELQDFETMLSKKDPKTAELPTVESRNIVPYLLKATMNTKPGIHFAMGLDKTGYVKLSSPLRRYTDLMIHWNLKAFWTKTRYPFSESDISSMIPRKTIIEKEIRQLCKLVDRHWLFEWIRRRQVLSNYPDLMKENAFVPHECELGIPRSWKWSRESNTSPEEQTLYDAFILRIDHDKKYFKVVVPIFFNYTTRCYYRVLSEEMFVGNKIKVRINSVDPGILDLKLDYVIS